MHCRIMNKKNAEFCQKCGGYWTECHEGESRSWTWTASSDSHSARRRSKPNHSKGKGGGKDPGAKEKGAGKESSAKGNTGKNASSPFAYLPTSNTMAPWPILDFEQFQQAPATPTVQQQQVNQSTQDLVLALKKAFPETASIPPALRKAMEKVESSGNRQITKDLHAATSALGRARKAHQEAHDARAKLRASWMKHLQESLRAWESQLDSYRMNMAKLQDAEAKALQEVSNAKRTIQQLNSHAEGAGVEETAAMEDMPGGEASSPIARSYDNVSLFSWRLCQEGGRGDFGRRRGEHQQKTKGFRNCQNWSLRAGRTLTCLQKAVVTKAKSVTFEVVEAYDCDQCDCAAGNLRRTVLSTEEGGMYAHSVVQEFDYTDPFAASLRAFNLRGVLLLGTANFGATELAVDGVGPHVNDRWCDPRPPQLDYRGIDSSGDHSDHDLFESDTSWLMQISESSPLDICCQQLLEQRFQELEDHSVENVRICCHGLSGSSVGSRYFVLEHAKLAALKQAVRQNWPEFHDAACKLYFVHPQPQDTLRPSWRTCVHIVVEFIDGRTACPIGAVPTLEESVGIQM